MLHRYASFGSRRFFYPYPPVPPVQSFAPIVDGAVKSGKWMEQARQMMAAAEQMRPLIEQYGPLVKNLPAMWKLYRAVQSMPENEASQSGEAVSINESRPVPDRPKTSESTPWFPGKFS
ncbi:VrrA/YqfQ family protein [Domibacillus enclensis]|uniref:YqfQ-like protein n=2 Tax=Domibacillus enclensis TaxID=1017273 RepID=A0ABX4EE23_9BACI|nr:VrrA/YqfQ family protein [Domibacillus enclensis]OXS80425.1 hypothetical protein B1B05_02795 [Domibacillus enclensis]